MVKSNLYVNKISFFVEYQERQYKLILLHDNAPPHAAKPASKEQQFSFRRGIHKLPENIYHFREINLYFLYENSDFIFTHLICEEFNRLNNWSSHMLFYTTHNLGGTERSSFKTVICHYLLSAIGPIFHNEILPKPVTSATVKFTALHFKPMC